MRTAWFVPGTMQRVAKPVEAGSYFRPADTEAEKRAETTGEETRCANCHKGFSWHNNGACPK